MSLQEYRGLSAVHLRDLALGTISAPAEILRQSLQDPLRGLRLGAYAGLLRKLRVDPEVIFWEPHTNPLDAAGSLIRSRWPHARLVAFPHNVEAVVPKDDPAKDSPRSRGVRFAREVAALQPADLVVGISTLDTQSFAIFGLPTVRYPYIPVADRQRALDALRARRATTPKRLLLMLGSAQNTPTRLGMQAQFTMIEEASIVAPELEIVLAGRRLPAPPSELAGQIRILESPSDETLADLLAEARGLWVHQALTTGALIRVADALSAGLPVVGNRSALQDYANCPGTFLYEDTPVSFSKALADMCDDETTIPRLLPDSGLLDQALAALRPT